MSEETKRELLSFLEESYNQGEWENLISFIDNNFISKKDIERTMNEN